MKADEPTVAPVKYGMAATEQHRIVERHFVVMHERQAIDAAQLAHALRVGPLLRVTMEGIGTRPKPTQPPAAPMARQMPDTAPKGLRERLGLE